MRIQPLGFALALALALAALPACDAAANPAPDGSAATCDAPSDAGAPACLGVGAPAPVAPDEDRQSVTGGPLTACSTDPLTGWFRDGTCRTGPGTGACTSSAPR